MAKRFTDTEKWKKKWIRGLDLKYKLFWVFILDDCNHAGIWNVDMDVANLMLGLDLTEKEILSVFKNKIFPIDSGEKWFIPKFIAFQYGELVPGNRVHASVLAILEKEGASKVLHKGLARSLENLNKPLARSKLGLKDKDKAKDKAKALDKAKDKDKEGCTCIESGLSECRCEGWED